MLTTSSPGPRSRTCSCNLQMRFVPKALQVSNETFHLKTQRKKKIPRRNHTPQEIPSQRKLALLWYYILGASWVSSARRGYYSARGQRYSGATISPTQQR